MCLAVCVFVWCGFRVWQSYATQISAIFLEIVSIEKSLLNGCGIKKSYRLEWPKMYNTLATLSKGGLFGVLWFCVYSQQVYMHQGLIR